MNATFVSLSLSLVSSLVGHSHLQEIGCPKCACEQLSCSSLAFLHLGIDKIASLSIAGYRNELGAGQDMYGLSTDPYDLHPEQYSRSVHGHATGDSSARLEDPRQQPQGFLGWQQPPAAHLYPSAGKLRTHFRDSLLPGKS